METACEQMLLLMSLFGLYDTLIGVCMLFKNNRHEWIDGDSALETKEIYILSSITLWAANITIT